MSAPIVIAGAGSIGCYVGAELAVAHRTVRLLLRPARAAHIRANGIRVSDLEGRNNRVDPGSFELETDAAAAFRDAALILVAVKRDDTAEIGRAIAAHAPPTTPVLCLQNGIGSADALAPWVAPRLTFPGVVMFNAVLDDADPSQPLKVHRATSGGIYVPEGHAGIVCALTSPGLQVVARDDMREVAWGKLLLNLNNALNALSGLPLREQLGLRPWRLLLARQMDEALAAMSAAGIAPATVSAASPTMIPRVLRLPDWLFKIVAARMLAIDPGARSSMWEDLKRGRMTEIDHLQGEIALLARRHNVAAPLTAQLLSLVRDAEKARRGSPALTSDSIGTH